MKAAIIVAGGSGKRMKQKQPKQFMLLHGKPVLHHTLMRFHQYDSTMQLIVVLPEQSIKTWSNLCRKHSINIPHQVVKGGKERFHSVKNGLRSVNNADLVAVHDGVRPLVSVATITETFHKASETGTAIPAVPSSESIRKLTEAGSKAVDRNLYRMIQTPQVFRAEILKRAYAQEYQTFFTDDASLVEHAGYTIQLVEGNAANIKITTRQDLYIANALLTMEKNNKTADDADT